MLYGFHPHTARHIAARRKHGSLSSAGTAYRRRGMSARSAVDAKLQALDTEVRCNAPRRAAASTRSAATCAHAPCALSRMPADPAAEDIQGRGLQFEAGPGKRGASTCSHPKCRNRRLSCRLQSGLPAPRRQCHCVPRIYHASGFYLYKLCSTYHEVQPQPQTFKCCCFHSRCRQCTASVATSSLFLTSKA